MYRNLFPGMIGIHNPTIPHAIALAKGMGFGGIDIDIRQVHREIATHGVATVRGWFTDSGIRAGNWIMPNDWKQDEAQWQELLRELPSLAAASRAVGCTRASTYFGSGSDVRSYVANFRWHVARLRPVTDILAEHGIAFGMEFMGPPSVRRGKRYGFIHDLPGMLELAAEIGTGNVGVLLDSWHLFTSGESFDAIDRLRPTDVVNVHVNDAPAGLTRDDYVDCDRRIPLETGVIDLPLFLRKLAAIGYDGPVTPEPFSARLYELAKTDPDTSCRITAEAMAKAWQLAGLTPAPATAGSTQERCNARVNVVAAG